MRGHFDGARLLQVHRSGSLALLTKGGGVGGAQMPNNYSLVLRYATSNLLETIRCNFGPFRAVSGASGRLRAKLESARECPRVPESARQCPKMPTEPARKCPNLHQAASG
eukprot:7342009-Alexandrium_andersonii.AAC.3